MHDSKKISEDKRKKVSDLFLIVRYHGLSQSDLARKMQMAVSSFKLKFNPAIVEYQFTDTEYVKLGGIVKGLIDKLKAIEF